MKKIFVLLLVFFFNAATNVSFAAEVGKRTGLPIPRFVSLRADKVNLRTGPSERYPIIWVYQRRNYPMEVIAEFNNWRKLRDMDGTVGWVHENLIVGKQYALIVNNKIVATGQFQNQLPARQILLYRAPDESSYPLVRAEIGALGKILKCQADWCQLQFDRRKGWIRKINLWGVYPD